MKLRRIRLSAADRARFWMFVPVGRPGCWEWAGPRDFDGYGKFNGLLAHRIAWSLLKGQPAGSVLHSCDNSPCVRPSHLFIGDAHVNARDSMNKGRMWGADDRARRAQKRKRYAATANT